MFKIGYLPLSKVNWTNDTLEAARANAIEFLKTLPDVEVIAPGRGLISSMDPAHAWVKNG